MTDDELEVEATGETVGEAKWVALRELEKLQPALDKAAVSFQVVSEGQRGLLGVGYAPARVIARVDVAAVPAPEPEPPREEESLLAARVRTIVERIAAEIAGRARVDVVEDDESLTVSVHGGDLALLIGKHGQTIDAVQYLVNAIVYGSGEQKTVVVDAAGYRERRRTTVESLAVRAADRAVSGGRAVSLEPMTAGERKLVHERLKEFPGVATRSEGVEPNRFVVVEPV